MMPTHACDLLVVGGGAGGFATALARERDLPVVEVPARELRAALAEQHVQLSHPMSEELHRHLAG